ncbi:MAG: penicillin-binding protein 2, partial [Actinomycetota bacterium]
EILTADGEQLVRNRPALTISADRQALLDDEGEPRDDEAERVIERLAMLLEIDEDEVLERLSSQRRSPFRPVPIETDVDEEVVFTVREQQELFAGVQTEILPVREYPHGTVASHLVGYVGEISQEELLDPEYTDYLGGDLIGRTGLEEAYEQDLRGTPGRRLLVVNARENVLDVQSDRPAVPGNDLVTSIDLDLQQATEELLAEGIESSRDIRRDDGRTLPSVAGAAVALDARSGKVLSMASYPDYDPREFVGGIDPDYWQQVTDRDNQEPLVNRAITGVYPPGSVFKPVSGAAMLEADLVGPRETRDCDAEFTLADITFRNWNRGVNEGPMDLADALRRSCDTYFYSLAADNWRAEQAQEDPDEVLVEVGERFGFGRELGIDLPGEESGVVPGREWKEQRWLDSRERWCEMADAAEPGTVAAESLQDQCRFGGAWRGGDAVNSSIGQGDVAATLLQVAASYQAIANDGVLMRPQIGERIVDTEGATVRDIEPEQLGDLGLSDRELAVIQEGLEEVVMASDGTAVSAFDGFPLDEVGVAGKTGTAEAGNRVPYSWFVAYAPVDDPQIVVAVNVEQGGGGSQVAAPIVRNILSHHFEVVAAEDATFEAGAEILD